MFLLEPHYLFCVYVSPKTIKHFPLLSLDFLSSYVCLFSLKSVVASTLYFKHFMGIIILLWILVFSLNLLKCFLPKMKRKLNEDAFFSLLTKMPMCMCTWALSSCLLFFWTVTFASFFFLILFFFLLIF